MRLLLILIFIIPGTSFARIFSVEHPFFWGMEAYIEKLYNQWHILIPYQDSASWLPITNVVINDATVSFSYAFGNETLRLLCVNAYIPKALLETVVPLCR